MKIFAILFDLIKLWIVSPEKNNANPSEKNTSQFCKSSWFKLFGKSLIWLLFTIVFGLLQFWVAIGNAMLLDTKGSFSFTEFHNTILMDGVLIFFATTLVATVIIDYYLVKKQILKNEIYADKKYVFDFLFSIFPIIIFAACIWLFTTCFGKQPESVNIELAKRIEFAILISVMIYTYLSKTILFCLEK